MSQTRIDEILQGGVDEGVLPGVVVTVDGPGSVLYRGAFGLANTETEQPMTGDTMFRISSLTKSLVGLALMQCVERGLLSLDQPLETIIPEFGRIQVLDGFVDGKPQLREPKFKATIAQVATHTAGLAYDVWCKDIFRYQEVTGEPSSFTGKREGMFLPLAFDPGTNWAYGTGTDWIADVVQAVTGIPIDIYLEEEVFAPLGMTDTTFEVKEANRSRLAAVHTRDDLGGFVATPFDWSPAERTLSGHGLYSTMSDYSRYLQMLLNGGTLDNRQLLLPKTLEQFAENRIGELDVPVMPAGIPTLTRNAEFFRGMQKKQSIGFQILAERIPGMRSEGSLYWAGLFNLFYWWDRINQIAVTFATHLLPFQDERVMDLFDQFERTVYEVKWQ